MGDRLVAQEKWADYLVTAVRYNAGNTHIDAVQLRQDRGDSAGPPVAFGRACAVSLLRVGASLCTVTTNKDGTLARGAPVGIVTVEGTHYLKTERDRTKADNLGRLPGF